MTYARISSALWLLVLVPACAPQQPPNSAEVPGTTITAVVNLAPTNGNHVQGSLTLTEDVGGVRITGQLSGLTPGEHGIHVHERGDCSAPDATSAGDHYNPAGTPHGGPSTTPHHTGDLGNITADAGGTAQVDQVFPGLSLHGARTILGRAMVVHAAKDDYTTQPAGASGARVACGVITQR
jgi:Cu-Zn family superoxide dismutase